MKHYDYRMGPLERQAVRDAQKNLRGRRPPYPPGTVSAHDAGSAIYDRSTYEQPKRGPMRNLFRRIPPIRRVSLDAFDHLPAEDAVRAAWIVPGPVPQYHRSMKSEVHARMPLLARALERLAKEPPIR